MKSTWIPLKLALCGLVAGAVMLVSPLDTFAQNRGGGGGNRGSGNRGSGQQGAQRGGGGGGGQRGGQSFSGQRGGGGRSYSNQRNYTGGQRSYSNRGSYYRGGSYGYYSAPYRSYGYRSYYPSYSYGYYGAYCNPNGYYDQWGRWYPDPRCGYDPYYGY